MELVEKIAEELDLTPTHLLHESLRTYLQQRLSIVESEMFLLGKKHGASNIFDFDQKIKDGLIHEENAYDDFFTFDNLTVEKEKIQRLLQAL